MIILYMVTLEGDLKGDLKGIHPYVLPNSRRQQVFDFIELFEVYRNAPQCRIFSFKFTNAPLSGA